MSLCVLVGIEGGRGEFGIQEGGVELGSLFSAVTLWIPADLQNRRSLMSIHFCKSFKRIHRDNL